MHNHTTAYSWPERMSANSLNAAPALKTSSALTLDHEQALEGCVLEQSCTFGVTPVRGVNASAATTMVPLDFAATPILVSPVAFRFWSRANSAHWTTSGER